VVEGVCMYMMGYVWVVEQERVRGFSATGRSTMLPAGLRCLAMSKNSCGRDTDMTEHRQHSTSSTPAPHRAQKHHIPSPSTNPRPPTNPLSLSFSPSPPKTASIASLHKPTTSRRLSPKCSAASKYSFDSGLQKIPTSSVCKSKTQ